MKIKEILEALENEPIQISKEQKREFVESVKEYSQLGEAVYGKGNLQELCERIKNMVEMAQQVTLAEGDWFDGITVNRHMKGLNESYKVFEKTAKEIAAATRKNVCSI